MLLFSVGDGESDPVGKAGYYHTKSLLEELYMDDFSVDATILRLERIAGGKY
ncbi:hypothetical protein [Chryseobacterium sp. R2A-55]|uniref:hypothetical protein n=1 Tax=Chryseobacterium sp. R2A-55 TaxID=2744445 RepID=UPI001F475D2B|nr:hypothetical protein [Chryseobacterium sp. R2A-55]